MANSKLLKEAIADAKAVKETALANAKLALEEAFTPRLQSILSQKMRAEAEAQDDEADKVDEELDSSNIGSGNSQPTLDADTDLSVGVKKDSGKPEQAGTDYKKVADINEENPFGDDAMAGDDKDAEIAELKARLAELEAGDDSQEEDPNNMPDASMGADSNDPFAGDDQDQFGGDDQMSDDNEDDMDLEAIIRELEAQLQGDDQDQNQFGGEEEDESMYEDAYSDGSPAGSDKGEDPKLVKVEGQDVTGATGDKKTGPFDQTDEVIDLEEILREMEADMKDDKDKVEEDEKPDFEKAKTGDSDKTKSDLKEAYRTIVSLRNTINEVNLLNAKLLFANKLFRAHNMTNEQKVKVIETLDRTKSVREVKLVYSTLAENFKYTTSNKSTKKSISEGIASKVTKSTKPGVAKQVIAESADFANRFKKLAGIIK
jgi:hypothetical protein